MRKLCLVAITVAVMASLFVAGCGKKEGYYYNKLFSFKTQEGFKVSELEELVNVEAANFQVFFQGNDKSQEGKPDELAKLLGLDAIKDTNDVEFGGIKSRQMFIKQPNCWEEYNLIPLDKGFVRIFALRFTNGEYVNEYAKMMVETFAIEDRSFFADNDTANPYGRELAPEDMRKSFKADLKSNLGPNYPVRKGLKRMEGAYFTIDLPKEVSSQMVGKETFEFKLDAPAITVQYEENIESVEGVRGFMEDGIVESWGKKQDFFAEHFSVGGRPCVLVSFFDNGVMHNMNFYPLDFGYVVVTYEGKVNPYTKKPDDLEQAREISRSFRITKPDFILEMSNKDKRKIIRRPELDIGSFKVVMPANTLAEAFLDHDVIAIWKDNKKGEAQKKFGTIRIYSITSSQIMPKIKKSIFGEGSFEEGKEKYGDHTFDYCQYMNIDAGKPARLKRRMVTVPLNAMNSGKLTALQVFIEDMDDPECVKAMTELLSKLQVAPPEKGK